MVKKLNIALVDDSFYPMVDGVANVVYNYAKYLAKKHNVTVFTSTPRIPLGKDEFPFKVVRCKSHKRLHVGDYPAPDPKHDPEFLKKIDQAFDIIHFHSPTLIPHAFFKIIKKYDIPTVTTLHTQYKLELTSHFHSRLASFIGMRFYVTPTFNISDEVWAMNEGTKALSRKYYYHGPVFVLQNGCDFLPSNVSKKEISDLKAKYVKDNEKLLLYVGRLSKLKNLKFVMQVAQKLKDLNYSYKLVLVGKGEHQKYLENLATKLDINDHVIFAGQVANRTHLQLYYMAADLLVFPSFYDTESLTKIEAAAVNLPTIFAKGSITASSVKDNYNGYIANANVEDFAKKIVSIFEDPKQYESVRRVAKETLYKTWEEIVNCAEKRYFEVIANHKKR